MHHYRRLVTAGPVRVAVLCALLAMQPVAVWAQPTGARYQVDQPAQPLSEVLKAIASQTNTSVLFDAAVVGKRLSKPVAGQFTGAEAISKALEGSGLTAEVMRDGAVVVKPGVGPGAGQGVRAPGSESSSDSTSVIPADANGRALPLQLAQAPAPAQSSRDAGESKPDERKAEQKQSLGTIEVTGSRIKRVEVDGALPVNVYTKEDIDRSGQPTLGGFLNTLNEVSIGHREGSTGLTPGLGTVQLRGLPIGTTLVLINGRRIQKGGAADSDGSFFNLNVVPFAAVERIEVLPVGSSAVYGGDALAGVINIILKKSFEGWAVETRYGAAEGTEDGGVSLMTGGRGERGSFLLLGAFNKTTPLNGGERDFFRDADYRRFGGRDTRSRNCTPGTVSSSTTANLPGLGSTLAGIPSLAPGQALTIPDFVPTAGLPNLCSIQGHGSPLVWGAESAAFHATGDYRIAGSWTVFSELTYADVRSKVEERGLLLPNVLVPASNPFNPFGVPVRVSARLGFENGIEGNIRDSEFKRLLIGTRGELTDTWEIESTLATTRDKSQTITRSRTVGNAAALTAALAASTPDLALNPFTAGRAASDQVLRGIWSDRVQPGAGEADLFNVFVRGSLLALPAGSVDLAAGLEFEEDRFTFSSTPPTFKEVSRRSNSQFAETRIPVLSSSVEPGQRIALVALTVAARRDSYSDFGDASTYQSGLEVRPLRTLLLRAATATSFKPPSLFQLYPQALTFPTAGFGLTDPLRGNEAIVTGEIFFGPAPTLLQPEEGKARTLGIVWEPDIGTGLRIGATAWQVKLRDQITLPGSPQFFLTNEALFPGSVTRGPPVGTTPGPVTRVNWTYVNFGKIDVAGTDLEAAYSLPTFLGKWSLSGGATRTSKYEVVLVPNAPVDDRRGKLNSEAWAPKWKGRLGAGLDRGPFGFSLISRYLGRYQDAGTSTRELGDLWFFDISASVDLRKSWSTFAGVARSAVLSLGVVNVGDRLPEFANLSSNYDFTQGDWRGRYYTLRLSAAW